MEAGRGPAAVSAAEARGSRQMTRRTARRTPLILRRTARRTPLIIRLTGLSSTLKGTVVSRGNCISLLECCPCTMYNTHFLMNIDYKYKFYNKVHKNINKFKKKKIFLP